MDVERDRERPRYIIYEALALTVVADLAVVLVFQIGRVLPSLSSYVPAAIAVIFLYVPAALVWRRNQSLADWGMTLGEPGRRLRSLVVALVVLGVVFPLFALGFAAFFQVTCHLGGPSAQLALPGACRRFLGWIAFTHPRLPSGFAEAALAQLVVVAIPEEVFFRGYLLARLEVALPPRRRWLGGGIGWALVLSSALFALSHMLVDPDPRRLAVFFPGLLFGWMRSATGSVAAGACVHAASNLYISLLTRTFFA